MLPCADTAPLTRGPTTGAGPDTEVTEPLIALIVWCWSPPELFGCGTGIGAPPAFGKEGDEFGTTGGSSDIRVSAI